VRLRLSATSGGDALGGHTITFSLGTVVQTILIGGEWEVESDASGLIVFEVTIAGAATRYIHADVLGKDRASDAVVWAA